jgi:adhesin transport system outer membrane protein
MPAPCLNRLAAAALLIAATFVQAQTGDEALRTAAQKALETNPDVSARLNALRAAVNAVDIARAGLLPRLDLDASAGHDRDRFAARPPAFPVPTETRADRTRVGLTLTQLLWDGLTLKNDISRLGHDKLARWFEFVDASEQAALEAARAHHDVLRFRRLVELAEDNYVQHRYAFEQIQRRFRAGVGRGVDLEQAAARVALAEANLTTETANLHDVTQRYLRVVGELPLPRLARPSTLAAALPPSPGEAMTIALRDNAAISASIENLRAARAAAQTREGAYQPRIEARLRGGGGRNLDGITDQRRDATAEIVLNWNLFAGGADRARVRQAADLVNQATDLRDRACRDARQLAGIAFNDTRRLVEQLQALERNAIAIEKARDAYRQQFDINQRSLLDLLNAENELYTAKRAYANADFDLEIAQLRTLAAMQRLTAQLGLVRPASPVAAETTGWTMADDVPARCPAVVADLSTTPKPDLDARVRQLLEAAPNRAPAPAR